MAFTVFRLFGAALLMALASALAALAERKTFFGKIPQRPRQILLGLFFGGLAVVGTEFGVSFSGTVLDVCDAAPLCAGLIFGAPAGLIAGVIGGVQRWIFAAQGAGEFTRLASSLAMVLSGAFAATLRILMLDGKKPFWFYGLLVGIVNEVLHMLMVFLTNLEDMRQAFNVIKTSAAPMILLNGIAVAAAILSVALLDRETEGWKRNRRRIAQTFQRWLLLCVLAAFAFTCAFTYFLQTRLTVNSAYELLELNISDVCEDIQYASDKNLLALTHKVADELEHSGDESAETLLALARQYSVAEINIVGSDGIIRSSTNPDFVGFDMRSGEQSAAFMPLLHGEDAVVQRYQPISYDAAISRKYAGVSIDGGTRFLQLAYDAEQFQRDIDQEIIGFTSNRHIGESGYIIICDQALTIISDHKGHSGQTLFETGMAADTQFPAGSRIEASVYGEDSLCMYQVSEGYFIIAVLPKAEAMFPRDVAVYEIVFMEILVFAAVFANIYFLIKKSIVDTIRRINGALSQITDGNLGVTVDVHTNEEFSALSDDINATVGTLKRYIAEAEARIDRELEFARAIQHSALPSVFPPYPGRTEFDIYASMDTAKEVGGDFYDFYLLGEDRLVFLVADVSGKGIPAAMFMMTAKTLLKSLTETGIGVDEVFTQANAKLCEENDAGMFVTAWMGILNLCTGQVDFANAGHNPPLVKHADGSFCYVKSQPGFVLAGIESTQYRRQELLLQPGDAVFLYTDGVTEATDSGNRLYGEDRLCAVLNRNGTERVERLVARVKSDVDAFAGAAPQFDDITMLALRYQGGARAVKTEAFAPLLANTAAATAFVEQALGAAGCPQATVVKACIVIDELFSNIARYSGATETSVSCGVVGDAVELTLRDDGIPYDPTAAPVPNVSLDAEDREVGGLGIHMVRNFADSLRYARNNGWNTLHVEMALPRGDGRRDGAQETGGEGT